MSNSDRSLPRTQTWRDIRKVRQLYDKSTTTRSLYREMHSKEIKNIGNHPFIPPSSLRELFTLEQIEMAVGDLEYGFRKPKAFAQVILDCGIAAFATLVWIKRPDLIRDFQQWNLLENLPIKEFKAVLRDSYDTFTQERMDGTEMKEFKDAQWRFLEEKGKVIKSGFSSVRALSICFGCHNFPDNYKTLVSYPDLEDKTPVRKEVDRLSQVDMVVIQKTLQVDCDDNIEEAYRNELSCLEHFTETGNENIITFLASYTAGKDMCFLFHCLEMDLRKFLRRSAAYGLFQYTHTYFSALHGLASALESIHKVKNNGGIDARLKIGYHHDLRPANVLVNSETFILTDFGMSRDDKSEENSKTLFKNQIGDYIAPECYGEKWKPQNVGRGIDIWAFGCLMSDVLTYAYGGVNSLDDFEVQRMSTRTGNFRDSLFYNQSRVVKEEVENWIEKLSGWADDCLVPRPKRADENYLGTHRPSIGNFIKTQILALLKPESERPNMQKVCLGVGRISLMAHFLAVLSSRDTVDIKPDRIGRLRSPKFLYVEYERLKAWGSVLGLYGDRKDIQPGEPLSSDRLGPSARELASFFRFTKDWSISEQLDDQEKVLEGKVKPLVDGLCMELERAWVSTANTRLKLELTAGQQSPIVVEKQYTKDLEELCRMRCLGHWRNLVTPPGARTPSEYEGERQEATSRLGYETRQNPSLTSPKDIADKPWLLEYLTSYGSGQSVQQPTSVKSYSTLSNILSVKKNTTDILSKHDKYKLAVILAEFIADTHTIGWPHDGFSSRNIKFKGLPDITTWKSASENADERAAIVAKMQRPFFIGLEATQQPPEQRNLSSNFYTLGVILLRIGIWSYVNNYNEERAQILSESMGSEYRDVVRDLMETDLFRSMETDPVKDEKAFSKFLGILRKLKESMPVPDPRPSAPQTNPKRDAGAETFPENLLTRNSQIPSRAAPSPIPPPPPPSKGPTKNTLPRRSSVGSSDRPTRTAAPTNEPKRRNSFRELLALVRKPSKS
ncbi:hypothetical protein TWF970_002299 [Orbilia oligospora]|uniref:Protein kinase domain-containing protein n=1 Tax=Orbilia oligospora TaxID=2813651 RepID=A0A7C8RCF6_ORBOL|nr:hypothetical protein TWF970_002299 [Orbilia oligospora]